MNIDSLFQTGVQLFKDKLDTDGDRQVGSSDIVSALTTLFGNQQGQLNLSSVIASMQNGESQDIMSLAESWLGTGKNAPVSGDQLTKIFGNDKIAAFAKQLGISESSALSGLQDVVPDVIDKASPEGSLVDIGEQLLSSVGGISSVMDTVGKLFGQKT